MEKQKLNDVYYTPAPIRVCRSTPFEKNSHVLCVQRLRKTFERLITPTKSRFFLLVCALVDPS